MTSIDGPSSNFYEEKYKQLHPLLEGVFSTSISKLEKDLAKQNYAFAKLNNILNDYKARNEITMLALIEELKKTREYCRNQEILLTVAEKIKSSHLSLKKGP